MGARYIAVMAVRMKGTRSLRSRATAVALGVSALLLLGPDQATAQTRVGLSVGGAISTVYSNHESLEPRGTWTYGAWLRAPVGGRLGVQLEGRLIDRGYRAPSETGVLFRAIEVPLLLTWDLSRRDADAAYVAAGIVGVVERSCTLTTRQVTFPGDLIDVPCDGSASRDVVESEDREVGAALGIGTEVRVGSALVSLDLRGIAGLTKLVTVSAQRETEVGRRTVRFAGRSVSLELLVGIGIP